MNSTHRVDVAKYTRNMEDLIDRTREHFTPKILCIGLAPIDQSKTVPFIERTISFFTADAREYDSALEKLCHNKKVGYVSLRDLAIRDHLSEDGVHPVSSGHAMIAERVLEAVTKIA